MDRPAADVRQRGQVFLRRATHSDLRGRNAGIGVGCHALLNLRRGSGVVESKVVGNADRTSEVYTQRICIERLE
jgi:hypothetical protein